MFIYESMGTWEEVINENLKISVVNLIILLTCILTLLYLFVSHLIYKHSEKKSIKTLKYITENSKVAIISLDFHTLKIKYTNKGFYNLTGFTRDEIERVYEGKFLSLGKGNLEEKIEEQLKDSSSICTRFEIRKKDGTFIWVYMQGFVESHKDKRTINCTIMDVDSLVREEEIQKFNEERYRIASEVAGDILFEYDIKTERMIFSDRFYDMFGVSEVIDDFIEFLKRGKSICVEDSFRIDELIEQIRYETAIQGEFRMKDISGNYVWVQLKGRKVRGKDDRYKKIYGKLINVNNVKVEISRLKEVSEVDVLTGIYNKGAIKRIVETAVTNEKNPITLIIIDVDNFKKVNDTLGHQYGDIVLSTLARKLKTTFPSVTFGRIGGDEFMGFTTENDLSKVENLAREINKITEETYENEGKICNVSTSLGIVIDSLSYDELFKKADDALYVTKKKGKNSYTIS